ncbi:hypothetical protein AAE478_008797 [Parahypoxylon ruwenzoriense]
MRLINVKTHEIHEFYGPDIPPYVTLSHTWAEGEVSFEDWQSGRAAHKQGFTKIRLTCEQAERDNFQWAWVDTCCINKKDSAETSEAINSMFKWYTYSSVCYAYLVDVHDEFQFPYVPPPPENPGQKQVSRWFTRAWTLQELIAPPKVVFYGRGWVRIGHRDEEAITGLISSVTNIPFRVLQGVESPSHYSVAQKMSWAAHRISTRLEDIAYSLLGLFDVSMPLLYGEGDKAFVRLQEEILRETEDHSILCWTVPSFSSRAWTLESVFAKSPDDFAGSRDIKGNLFDSGFPSSVTNRGLQIHLYLSRRRFDENSHLYYTNSACSIYDAVLAAGRHDAKNVCFGQVSIILVRTPQITPRHEHSANRYTRLVTPELGLINLKEHYAKMTEVVRSQLELIYIHKTLFSWERDRFGLGGVHLQNIPIEKALAPLNEATYYSSWDYGYAVSSVFYPGRDQELRNTAAVNANLDPGGVMTWSPIYGCIQFGLPFRLEGPYVVVFGIESPIKPESFSIVLAWDSHRIHFSLRPGRVLALTLRTHQDLLDPTEHGTRQGYLGDLYGEIARAGELIGDYYTELTLVREDPKTPAGEAAGNRLHLLIQASFTREAPDDVEQEKMSPSGRSSLSSQDTEPET